MSRPRVLVTGGTGFVGRALVPRLLARADVTLLLLEEYAGGLPLPAPLDRLRPEFDVAYGDLRNYQLTARAVRQAAPERVIHLAAAGVSDPYLNPHTTVSHNVGGALNLLRACFEGGQTQQLIVARTPGETAPTSPYAASKAAAWAFCAMYARSAGWPIHGAMIFQAYGPGQPPHLLVAAALAAARAGQEFPMTDGRQAKDWVYIDDVADGLLALLGAELPPGTTVELGTGQATEVRTVVEQLYALVGRGGRPLPGALPSRPGEAERQAADAAMTAALISWRARVGLDEGLARLVADDGHAKLLAQPSGSS
jgi:nucleoside-diphosphate-sugar epimerase